MVELMRPRFAMERIERSRFDTKISQSRGDLVGLGCDGVVGV